MLSECDSLTPTPSRSFSIFSSVVHKTLHPAAVICAWYLVQDKQMKFPGSHIVSRYMCQSESTNYFLSLFTPCPWHNNCPKPIVEAIVVEPATFWAVISCVLWSISCPRIPHIRYFVKNVYWQQFSYSRTSKHNACCSFHVIQNAPQIVPLLKVNFSVSGWSESFVSL